MAAPFQPTHTVPAGGAPTWPAADPTRPQGPDLAPGTPVVVAERVGDWARIVCANGFTAWVDSRVLVAGTPTPTPTSPTSSAALDARVAQLEGMDFSFSKPMLGAGLILLGGIMSWARADAITYSGFNVSVMALLDNDQTIKTGMLSVGLLMIVAAGAAVVGLVVPGREVLRRIAGFGAVAVAVLFTLQLLRLIGDNPGSPSLLKTLGFGVPVTLAGGLLAALAPGHHRPSA